MSSRTLGGIRSTFSVPPFCRTTGPSRSSRLTCRASETRAPVVSSCHRERPTARAPLPLHHRVLPVLKHFPRELTDVMQAGGFHASEQILQAPAVGPHRRRRELPAQHGALEIFKHLIEPS